MHSGQSLKSDLLFRVDLQLIQQLLSDADGHFEAMSGGRVNSNELVATLISQRPTIAEGIRYAQNVVEGTVSVLIMTPDCLIAGRDKFGRLPIHIGQDEEGCCVAFESFAYQKMGYHDAYELGPAEVVKITFSLLLAKQLAWQREEKRDLRSFRSAAMAAGHTLALMGW